MKSTMSFQKTEIVPQGGNVAEAGKKSSTVQGTVCPTDSGGGKNSLDIGIVSNPFTRKDRVHRSPNRGRSGSLESPVRVACANKPNKRPRDDTEDDAMVSFRSDLNKLTSRSKELVQLIEGTANTKSEIKTAARDIKWQLDCLNRRLKEWDDSQTSQKKRSVMINKKSVETQTERIEEEAEGADKEDPKLINHIIDTSEDFRSLKDIIDINWSESMYRKAKVETGRPLVVEKDWDEAFLADPKDQSETGLIGYLKSRAPEVVHLLRDSDLGTVEYCIQANFSSRKEDCEQRTYRFVVPLDINPEGVNDLEDLYKQICNLKQVMKSTGRQKVQIAAARGLNVQYIRKIVENIFRKDSVEIKLIVPNAPKVQMNKQERKSVNTNPRRETETLIIKVGERTYAELVKTLRSEVDVDNLNVKVNSIRKTEKGDLMVRISGEQGKAAELRSEIVSKMKDTEVNIKNNQTIFNILNIGPDVEKNEMVEALVKETEVPETAIQIKSVRPTRNGNQIATVAITNQYAKLLKQKNKVKIGWLMCSIRARVEVLKCFKCQSYGHISKDCTSISTINSCYNCGKEGHHANSCQEEAQVFCLQCNKRDHKGGSGACPLFRALLKEAREADRKRGGRGSRPTST